MFDCLPLRQLIQERFTNPPTGGAQGDGEATPTPLWPVRPGESIEERTPESRLSQLTFRVKKSVMMNPSSFSSLYTTTRCFPVFISRTAPSELRTAPQAPIGLADSLEHIQTQPASSQCSSLM
jgi:hypothetical protein